jgi:predicted acetyltransferase
MNTAEKHDVSWSRMTIDELDLILGLMEDYYAYDHLDFDRAFATEALRTFITQSELGQGWLIRLDDSPIGYIVMTNGFSLEFGGIYQYIDEFFIIEGYRGRGFGAQTLKYVERFGQEIGVKSIHLEVDDGNIGAQKFYSQLGYGGNGRFLWSKDLE